MGTRRIISAIVIFCIIIAGALTGFLFYTGVLKPVMPGNDYPIRGVDVSSYQGEVDWDVIAAQGISFAFVKATEGSSLVDPCFARNYENAAAAGLRVGAYHFFSFDSPAETQADNFIKTVAKTANMLPPVIDVELYGKYLKSPPEDTERIKKDIEILISRLTDEYGVIPIIYTTGKSMKAILDNDTFGCDLWIRNVLKKPGDDFTFWQYTSRGRLSGFNGREKYIDLNVFNGTAEEFSEYGRKKA